MFDEPINNDMYAATSAPDPDPQNGAKYPTGGVDENRQLQLPQSPITSNDLTVGLAEREKFMNKGSATRMPESLDQRKSSMDGPDPRCFSGAEWSDRTRVRGETC